MSDDENNSNDDGENNEPDIDPTIEKIEGKLDDGGKGLTLHHLEELKTQLESRIDVISKDKSKDEEYRNEMKSKVESLDETIKKLTEALEKKESSGGDSTMLVPPDELNPKQQNLQPEGESSGDSSHAPERKKGWKRYI